MTEWKELFFVAKLLVFLHSTIFKIIDSEDTVLSRTRKIIMLVTL